MQIGAGRPLCCFFWALSCAVALYVFVCPSAATLALFAVIAAVLVVFFVTLAVLDRRRRFRFLYVAFVILGLVAGSVASLLYDHNIVRPASDYAQSTCGEATEVQGLIISREVESRYINAYGVCVRLPSGQECMTYLRVMGESELTVGDEVRVDATLEFITETDEQAWFVRYLRGEGYLLIADAQGVSEENVLSEGNFVLREALAGVQSNLSYRLTRAIGGEQGKLASALLLGTRSSLSDMTVLDFRRAGASHLLALSGLHLSMIMLMLGAILRTLCCPYRWRMLVLPTAAIAFLLLTGCSVSTLRATVMLLFVYASRWRGVPHDSLTSLSAFFGLCLAVRPTWLLDVGLWLTVLATLAVIEIIPALTSSKKDKKGSLVARLLGYVGATLGGSAVVVLVLMVPMALFFGEFSWLAPVANLLLTPLTALVLGLGLLCLPVLYLTEIAPALARVSDLLCDALHAVTQAMLNITAKLSDTKGALISLRYDFIPYLLALLLIAFLSFLLFKWNRPRRFVGVLAGWCVLLGVCFSVMHLHGADRWQATYTVHGKSELLTLNRGTTAVLCDLTDGSYTTYRALLDNGLPKETTEIEALVLTHYHQRHIASVYKLLGDSRVRTLYLPLTMPDATQDKAVQDEGILRSIAALAKEHRVRVQYYLPSEGADITDTLTLERLYYDMLKRSTHPTLTVCWSYRQSPQHEKEALALLGASVWEGKMWQEVLPSISACKALVLSSHGPVIKTDYSIPVWTAAPNTALFVNGHTAAALQPNEQTARVLRDAVLYFADQTHTSFELP